LAPAAEVRPAEARARLQDRLIAGLSGEATLIPLFHLLRTARRLRDHGFTVAFDGITVLAPTPV
jgi:hypothetical protein